MGIQMTVACPERTDEDLHGLVGELTAELSQVQGLDAAPVERPAPAGSRGGAVTLGEIALTFITSGAAIAAINVLKTYFQREPSMKATFTSPDGETVTIDAKHMNAANTELALKILSKSVGKRR